MAAVPRAALRRLLKELALVQKEPSWGVSAAPVSEEDLFVWHCNVAGHPPGGGPPVVLHLELTFTEEYPMRPPRVEVLGSTVKHPNVFSTFICLDMLEGGEWAADQERQRPYSGWSSAYNVQSILRQLQTFFFEGDGTRWWACTQCTLHNPITNRRCEICDHPRGRIAEIGIEVNHRQDFVCRCGHTHQQVKPEFPDASTCEDAPFWEPPPEGCKLDEDCVICLGSLLQGAAAGPLRGSTARHSLARLAAADGSASCSHFFHLECARALRSGECPLCRAPFAQVQECEAPESASSPTSRRAPPAALGRELQGAARMRMARLAEWPLDVAIKVMECLLRPERASLGRAIPVWQEAAHASIFWEAQELQCFHEKTGPEEDVIGIGVMVSGRGKLITLTAHFDAVSLTAWRGGLRRAAWKEPMSHWLPLFIHHAHAERAAPHLAESFALLAACAPSREDSHLPPGVLLGLREAAVPQEAEDAVVALPSMMHELLKQVLYGDRHASLKLLKGYFVLHRLFLHCCERWPAIRVVVDNVLREFISGADQRTKDRAPWLAYLLQMLTVSTVGWEDVKQAFLEECLAREVQFTKRQYPNYRMLDPDEPAPEVDDEQLSAWTLRHGALGAERDEGERDAEQLAPDVWRGRDRGWVVLRGPFLQSRSQSFSVRVRSLPADAVVRIGFVVGDNEEDLVGSTADGWGFHASPCFGTQSGYLAHRGSFTPYGCCFGADDVVTAQLSYGQIRFQVNGRNLGHAFYVNATDAYIPAVALKRGAEVELLPLASGGVPEDLYPSIEKLRDMAWDANRKGNTLVMFQVFFMSLVRPKDGTRPDWAALMKAYDKHLGFPTPELSASLLGHYAEVHRVRSLRGRDAWPCFLNMVGWAGMDWATFDRLQFAAYERAAKLDYRQGGRHDHA